MKNAMHIFSELGARLVRFGGDDSSREMIARACEVNGWFTPEDVQRAVAALRDGMLQYDLLTEWLANYAVPVPPARRVLVVMAGNIPLIGFFDLLCVVASGHHCMVKPSTKDSVLMEYIIGLLREIEPEVRVSYYDGQETVDAVIATGSDNANRYFRARYADIPTLLRGSRQSVAVLAGNETQEQLRGLKDDLFAYSGLGCRNVSLVFLPQGYVWQPTTPDMNPKYRNNYRQTKALLEMTGVPFRDAGSAVLVEECGFSPALSRIHYTYYESIAEVEAWLAEHDDTVQCVVSDSATHSRRVSFGQAQWPTLTDYPDDRDVIEFLLNI